MPRPPAVPPEDKTRLVLSILAGEMTIAEAARKAKVSEQSVSTHWRCPATWERSNRRAEEDVPLVVEVR